MSVAEPSGLRRCAVIYNPVKVSDLFRETVSGRLGPAGYGDVLWLETTEQDPGRSMVADAVRAGVDLVIGAGGDGTIRIVADGLAGTGVALGIVPAGTGNLLARNLQLPLTEPEAVDVALTGHTQAIDLIKLTADGDRGEHFAVMAGTGIDAMIMDETSPALKATIGSAAYVLAAAKALGRLPMRVQIKVDDRRAHRRQALLCVIGNVGDLQGGITLIPGAKVDDGLLNVYVASPHRLRHWLRLLLRLATRRPHRDDQVDQWHGRRVEIRLSKKENYQLDGDVVGECRKLVAEVQPGALTVCLPALSEATSAHDLDRTVLAKPDKVRPARSN